MAKIVKKSTEKEHLKGLKIRGGLLAPEARMHKGKGEIFELLQFGRCGC